MIARDWIGETAFVIAGGPSVTTQPIELLRGRRVIVINSSWKRAPWADVLLFYDGHWWREYKDDLLKSFRGLIYTVWPKLNHPRVIPLRNTRPPEHPNRPLPPLRISRDRAAIPVRRTSLVGALNIALLKGVQSIVVLGADGRFGPNGERNCFEPYPFAHIDGCWDRQHRDLKPFAADIAASGVEVINCSPGTAWGDLWPVMPLAEALALIDARVAA